LQGGRAAGRTLEEGLVIVDALALARAVGRVREPLLLALLVREAVEPEQRRPRRGRLERARGRFECVLL
jgi:hypothetical protein